MTNEKLSEIYEACFPQDPKPWKAQDFAQFQNDKNTRVDTSASGALITRQILDEVEILTLFIHPDAQGQGQASTLLKKRLQNAPPEPWNRAFLEVAEDNKAAISLYRKFGFEEIGTRRGYYARKNSPPQNAITMSLMQK